MFSNNTIIRSTLFVICGGIHPFEYTQSFVSHLTENIPSIRSENLCIIPTTEIPPYDVVKIEQYLQEEYGQPTHNLELILIGFSAGVVGCIGAGRLWYRKGGIVKCLLAFDGWGVPLMADFPCYRLSHDYFTHVTSQFLGGENQSFYAQPAVSHLDLWRSISSVQGYWQNNQKLKKSNLIEFLQSIICDT